MRTPQRKTNAEPTPRGRAERAPPQAANPPEVQFQRALGNQAYGRFVQAELAVGAPDDPYEREADRVADGVVRTPGPVVQRMCACGGTCASCREEDRLQQEPLVDRVTPVESQPRIDDAEEVAQASSEADSPAPPSSEFESHVRSVRDGGGQPMSPRLRAFYEPRFGADFSRGRIHTGGEASEAARTIHARAFTAGRDVVFRTGAYAPDTQEGRHLLAHELTHVVQQTAPGSPATPDAQRQVESEAGGGGGLIVDGEAGELAAGQMRKAEFLDQARAEACQAAAEVLARIGRSTEGCPYLDYWYAFYLQRDSRHLERAIRLYVPEAAAVETAAAYLPLLVARLRQGVERWVQTGELTGVPEGVPTDLPGSETDDTLQFKTQGGEANPAATPAGIRAELGEGQPFGGSARARMESAFGTSLSGVRVHTDASAASLSAQQNARGFTVGRDVAFGQGEYRPGTPIGDALLAHELAHVVQQRHAASGEVSQRRGEASYGSLEEDADRAAVGAVVGLWTGVKERARDVAEHAMPRLKSGLRLQRCLDEYDYSVEFRAQMIYGELSKEDYEDIDKSRIFRMLRGLDEGEAEELRNYYQGHYSDRRQGRSLTEDLRHVLLSQSGQFTGIEGAVDLYRTYEALETGITTQTDLASTAADRIAVEPANAEVLPGVPVTYRMRVANTLPRASRFKWLVKNDPTAGEGPDYVEGPDGTVWSEAVWEFSGRHKVVCLVKYDSGAVHFFEYVQVVRDIRELAREEVHEVLNAQPSDIREEQLGYETYANRIRQKATEAGMSQRLFDRWVKASAAVVVLEAELRDANAAIPADVQTQARTALRAFYTAFRNEVASHDSHETIRHPRLPYPIHTTSNPYLHPDAYDLRLRLLDQSDTSWQTRIAHFYKTSEGLDRYVRDLLTQSGRGEDVGQLEVAGRMAGTLSNLLNEHPTAQRVRAAFYPEAQVLENTGSADAPAYDLEEIGLNFYVYREDDEWYLVDLTNIDNPIVSDESGGSASEPPMELFEELNTRLRFPQGVLFWEMPGGQRHSIRTTEPWSLSDWLRWIGVGIAVLAITASTLGFGTPATVLIVSSALLGAAAAAADIYERADVGVLTAQSVVVNVVDIVASLATAGTATLGRVVATGAFATGRYARLAALADRYYVRVAVASLAADLTAFATFAGTLLDQYNAIEASSASRSERDMAQRRLLQLALLTGAMTILAVRGGLADVRQGRNLYLDLDFGREVIARPLMSLRQLRDFARGQGVLRQLDAVLGRVDLSDEMKLRIRADLSAAIDAPNIPNQDVQSIIAALGRAPDFNGVQQALAELRYANRLATTQGVTSGLRIGARRANEPFRLSDDVTVSINPVDEADALYLQGGIVHLDEVKNTASALRQKLGEGHQLANMVAWRDAAGAGPPRAIKVHVETEQGWTDIFRPIPNAPRGSYTLQELINNNVPLRIGPYELPVAKMEELRDAILAKARELGEFPPTPAFFGRMSTLEEASSFLGIDL